MFKKEEDQEEEMKLKKLSEALDDEANDGIMKLSTRKILEMNLSILKELHLSRETTLEYLKKLKAYRYIDEMKDLKYGAFIRWIPITDPDNLQLKYCGIICDIKITDNGVLIVCKNFMHRCYSFIMDKCLIFQKLTNQEQVIISALDHLEKELNEKNQQKQQLLDITKKNKNYNQNNKKQNNYNYNQKKDDSDESESDDDEYDSDDN
jgi:hypothetical protein